MPHVAPVQSHELPQALALLARGQPDPARAAAELTALLADGELLAEDIVVARERDAMVGAMLAQRLGGAQASLGLPVADDDRVVDALIRASVEHLAKNGQRVLQVLAADGHPFAARFEPHGFAPITELIYLQRPVAPADAPAPPPRLTLRPARAELPFAELIAETFVESQDLPELIGRFSTLEILENFRRTTTADSPLWFTADFKGFPCGVLLLTALDSPQNYELTYMGLIPSARRRGLGVELARHALATVAARGGTHLELSRDARNHSAGRVYDQLGFAPSHRRRVRLKFF